MEVGKIKKGDGLNQNGQSPKADTSYTYQRLASGLRKVYHLREGKELSRQLITVFEEFGEQPE